MASYRDFLPVVSDGEWVRPSDWLALPTVTSAEQKFVGLHAVFPDGDNVCALLLTTSTGQYQVDWGDGTVTLHNSNTKAEHQYDYSTISASTDTSRGYRQVLVTVTPVSGNILTINFQQRYTARNQIYATGWLDVIGSFPNASSGASITFGGDGQVRQTLVEQVTWVTIGGVTNCTSMFSGCRTLQSVPLFNTASVTGMNAMFFDCFALGTIPLLNTSNVTIFSQFLWGCVSLNTIPLIDTSSAINMSLMFFNCTGITEIPLLDTSSVTTMSQMFFNCKALTFVPLLDTSALTSMFQMFRECDSLTTIPLFDTANVTSFTQMFYISRSIVSIPALSTASVTTSSGGDYLEFALQNLSLARCEMIFARTVSFSGSGLGAPALVEIFTNLVDRSLTTSATITITNNWGAALLTAGERLIATNKNWVITG